MAWLELVSGRRRNATVERRWFMAWAEATRQDPIGAAALWTDWRHQRSELALPGVEPAVARRRALYQALEGTDPPSMASIRAVVRSAAVPRATAHEDGLVLTEMDIEGWLTYVSLCREVQGGGPLKLSIATRQRLYRQVVGRFTAGPANQRAAWVALGGLSESLRRAWREAPAARQQAWIRSAPLPPPQVVSSGDYAAALLAEDPRPHVEALFAVFDALRPVGAAPTVADAPSGAPP